MAHLTLPTITHSVLLKSFGAIYTNFTCIKYLYISV